MVSVVIVENDFVCVYYVMIFVSKGDWAFGHSREDLRDHPLPAFISAR